jgi:hypothetical protein
MKRYGISVRNLLRSTGIILITGLFPFLSPAQQLKITDFSLFGGNGNCPGGPGQYRPSSPGCGVIIGTGAKINGGSIGSYSYVQTNSGVNISGNIYSGGSINLASLDTVSGRMTAANSSSAKGKIFQADFGSRFLGNIDVNGNIFMVGGVVSGRVTHPVGTTYTGPAPAGGNVIGLAPLPILPVMPAITNFPAAGNVNINATKTIVPGSYGDISLNGGQTITFSGPGIYVFKSIKNSGLQINTFNFDFKNSGGTIKIYVYGDVDVNILNENFLNGGDASRIFLETHGSGSSCSFGNYAFTITNYFTQGRTSQWFGTVWAPYSGINIGSAINYSNITGALWSGTQVNIQYGIKFNFLPFVSCSTPDAHAGSDQQLSCTKKTVQLNGSSNTAGAQFIWTGLHGGLISGANTLTPVVSTADTFVLKVTDPSGGCTATDTAVVSFVSCILPYYPPPAGGKTFNLIGSELNSLYQNFGSVKDSAKTIFIINQNTVQIEVIAKQGQYQNLLSLLQTPAYGISGLINNGPNSLIITGTYPIANLKKLDSLPLLIDYCRPLFPPLGKVNILPIQGDTVMHSNFVKQGYDLSGNGVKVGVISDSYNTLSGNPASADMSNGILPGPGTPENTTPVNVLQEYPYGKGTDEGRAMLEIVHGVAPKATLDFRTGFISPGDFAQGIIQLQQDHCQVIVDDVAYITEPFFQDGVVAQAVNYVASQGVSQWNGFVCKYFQSYNGTGRFIRHGA